MTHNYTFEWDSEKAKNNRKKHGVSFDEAATVFKDSRALTIFDPDHSEIEDRWITLGVSEKARCLIVVHTFRDERESHVTIRIVSSRKANKHEMKTYGE